MAVRRSRSGPSSTPSAERVASSGNGRRLQPQAAVFLYHQRTGRLSHTHFFAAAPGAELPPREELERVALAHAEKDGCNLRRHKVLHVDPATLKPGTGYRVSVTRRALIEVTPRRSLKRRRTGSGASRPK
ncbi:MAG: hypothetical protein JOY64_03345 [Alphaproteobacteria bacterium]|nr:hypothetical protein [Alphaproteobacteria bacterium]MBV8406639.1 hypothetical protein [Alphaproteobacteria bacterium]